MIILIGGKNLERIGSKAISSIIIEIQIRISNL